MSMCGVAVSGKERLLIHRFSGNPFIIIVHKLCRIYVGKESTVINFYIPVPFCRIMDEDGTIDQASSSQPLALEAQ